MESRKTTPISAGSSSAAAARDYHYETFGKRSGVRSEATGRTRSEGFENIDFVFGLTRSPDPADIAAGEKPVEQVEERKSPREPKKQLIPLNNPRLSLPGASKESQNVAVVNESVCHARLRNRNFTFSPSDMSTVSTAPPTPVDSESSLMNIKDAPLALESHLNRHHDCTDISLDSYPTFADPENAVVDMDLVPPLPPHDEDVLEAASQEHYDQTLSPPNEGKNKSNSKNKNIINNLDSRVIDFDFPDRHEENCFPNCQHDVGLPSKIDAAEKKSDDLNDDGPSNLLGNEYESKGKIRQPDQPLAEESKETDSLAGKKTPHNIKPGNPVLGANNESKPIIASKTPENDPEASIETPVDHRFCGNRNDHGEDREREGSNMVHDPETPECVRDERIRREEKEMAQQRKKQPSKKKGATPNDDVPDSVAKPAKSFKCRKGSKKVKIDLSPRGYPSGPRGYSVVPIDDLVDDEEPKSGLRRSKRARTEPLQYWRNERFVYGANTDSGLLGLAMGNMPVVKSALKACDTPYKKRKIPENKHNAPKLASKKSSGGGHVHNTEKPFDARKLRKKYNYVEGESALVWNDGAGDALTEKVIAYSKNLARHDLPLPVTRKRSDGKVVGRAAQAFNILNDQSSENYVGYIMGHLALPPDGIKDYESVGLCAQLFTVCHCQPYSLEVSIADPEDEEQKYVDETAQRFLLGPGDMFRVPQNNTYQLRNHSKIMECMLTWTIIRPYSNIA